MGYFYCGFLGGVDASFEFFLKVCPAGHSWDF